jgi:hypothetical protein
LEQCSTPVLSSVKGTVKTLKTLLQGREMGSVEREAQLRQFCRWFV